MADVIGYVAGAFIMVSFVPQVVRSWRTRSVGDLSLLMILATLAGTILWFLYGMIIRAAPIVVMNAVFGVLVSTLLFLKIRYDR